MSMTYFHKLASMWWLRILTLLSVSAVILGPIRHLLIRQDYSIISIYPVLLMESGIVCLTVLIISIIIESLRKEGKWFTVGLMPGKWMLEDIGLGLFINLGVFFIILFIALIFNTFSSEFITFNSGYFVTVSLLLLIEAVFEELMFRGIIFQALLERFGIIVSVSLTSILFATGHLFNSYVSVFAFLNIILAGLMFSAMYIKTYSLWLPISFHFFWNWGQAILGSRVSGIDFSITIINIDWLNLPAWFFGGSFGLEGGILATIFIIISTIISLKYSNVSPYLASILFKRRYAESMLMSN